MDDWVRSEVHYLPPNSLQSSREKGGKKMCKLQNKKKLNMRTKGQTSLTAKTEDKHAITAVILNKRDEIKPYNSTVQKSESFKT